MRRTGRCFAAALATLVACSTGGDGGASQSNDNSTTTESPAASSTSTTNVAQSEQWQRRGAEILSALGSVDPAQFPDSDIPTTVFRTEPVDLLGDGAIDVVVDAGDVAVSSFEPLRPWAFEMPSDLTGIVTLMSVRASNDGSQLIASVQVNGLNERYDEFTFWLY